MKRFYTGSLVFGTRMGYELNRPYLDSRASMILCLETQLSKNDEVKSNLISGEMSCRGVKDVAGRKSPPPQQKKPAATLWRSPPQQLLLLLLVKIAKNCQKNRHPSLKSARK